MRSASKKRQHFSYAAV